MYEAENHTLLVVWVSRYLLPDVQCQTPCGAGSGGALVYVRLTVDVVLPRSRPLRVNLMG
jgi:hypothetical protein